MRFCDCGFASGAPGYKTLRYADGPDRGRDYRHSNSGWRVAGHHDNDHVDRGLLLSLPILASEADIAGGHAFRDPGSVDFLAMVARPAPVAVGIASWYGLPDDGSHPGCARSLIPP